MASRILKNITWLTLGNALARPAWLLFLTVVCIPVLGDDGYGIFTATLALMTIAITLSDLGITPFSIREVARQPTHAAQYATNFFLFKSLVSLLFLGGALGVGLALGYRGNKFIALALAGGYALGLHLTEYCRAYYRAAEQMQFEAASAVLEKGLVITAGMALLTYYRTPEAVLGGMALGITLTLVLNLAWTHRRLAPFRPDLLSPRFLRRTVPTALPLGLAAQFTVIYFRTDAVMLEAMAGETAAGQYGAAYRMLEAVVLLAAMITTAVYPRLSALFHEKQHRAFERIFHRSLAALAGLGLVMALGFTFLADPLMNFIKGGLTVAASAKALRILAWAAPLMGVNFLLGITLSAADDQRMLAWMTGLAALLNILLNALLIPSYSLYGAAAATLATEAFITVLFGFRYLRHLAASSHP